MASYKELQDQIAQLQQQAEEARQQEIASVIAEIKQRMAEYGISVADLGGRIAGKKKGDSAKGQPKYRDPSSGATWTGKGKAPRWIKDHESRGRGRDDFLVR